VGLPLLLAFLVPFAILVRGCKIFPNGGVLWRLVLIVTLYATCCVGIYFAGTTQYWIRPLTLKFGVLGALFTLPILMGGIWLIFQKHEERYGAILIACAAVPVSWFPIAFLSWGLAACSHGDCF
jgi:hypothetical protein